MKVLLEKASDWSFHKNIEINSLDELLDLSEDLIIYRNSTFLDISKNSDCQDYDKDFDFIVLIYDDYVE